MTLRDLPPSSRREAVRFAAEVVRKTEHRGTSYVVDDDGFCHVRGEYGNPERGAFEYTKAEVIALRCILRERGAATAFDVAEGLLAEALAVADGWYTVTVSTSAERMARKRAKAPRGLASFAPSGRLAKGSRRAKNATRRRSNESWLLGKSHRKNRHARGASSPGLSRAMRGS